MFSSQWLQQRPAVHVLRHTLGNVLRFLPFHLVRVANGGLQFQLECTKSKTGCQWKFGKNGHPEAQIYCARPTHSLPRLIFPMIAVWEPIFCSFCLNLHVMGIGIVSRSRERRGCYPQMLKNQCLEGWLPPMCKSCGKKCLSHPYLFNSTMQLNSGIGRFKISMKFQYVTVLWFAAKNTLYPVV